MKTPDQPLNQPTGYYCPVCDHGYDGVTCNNCIEWDKIEAYAERKRLRKERFERNRLMVATCSAEGELLTRKK